MTTMTRKLFTLRWILLLYAVVSLAGCRLGRAEPPPLPASVADRFTGTTANAPLSTVAVRRGEVVQEVLYSGQVVLGRQENLFFQRSGRITQVYVSDGDPVQAGDLLAELDNAQLQLDLEAALLSLEIAQQRLADAEAALAFERRQAELNLQLAILESQPTPAPNNLTVTEEPNDSIRAMRAYRVELAQLRLNQVPTEVNPILVLGVRQAELAVQKVQDSILDGQILAPFDGEVRFINLPEGDQKLAAQAYAAVARIVEPKSFQIELNLPRAQLEPLREGMAVEVSAASLPGETLSGVIRALPRPFGTSQGSLTEVILNNPADTAKLYEGITVAVRLALKSQPNALMIPRIALRQENQTNYVFVPSGESVQRVNVAIGVVGNEWVEVIGGIDDGDQVVVSSVR
jgi:multidrug efflux pump subunit AcrA (membrane-fusion protein)